MAFWQNITRRLPLSLGDPVPEIEARRLFALLEDASRSAEAGVQLVDVRTDLEWRTSRIRGAAHAPLSRLESDLASLGLDPTVPTVCICLSAHRSIPAVRLLRTAGFARAQQLAGGMLAWWAAGLPTERGDAGEPR